MVADRKASPQQREAILKELKRTRGLSRVMLAEVLGMDHSTLGKKLQGRADVAPLRQSEYQRAARFIEAFQEFLAKAVAEAAG